MADHRGGLLPRRLPFLIVDLAVRRMPWLVGYRYQRELYEELRALPESRRLGLALRVLLHAHALRVQASAPGRDTATPWRCRLHLAHSWALVHRTDGAYVACRDCGRPSMNTIFDPVVPRT